MVKLKTTFSFGFTLDIQRVKETLSSISKVLRVATEMFDFLSLSVYPSKEGCLPLGAAFYSPIRSTPYTTRQSGGGLRGG